MRFAWSGRAEEALALQRLVEKGAPVTLALQPDEVVPDFVLEAQAAALALPHTRAAAERTERGPLREAVAAGWRAVVVEAEDAAVLGRFVDEVAIPEGARTLAVEGPLFTRRVEVVAGEVRRGARGWRLEVGLRGC